MSPGFQLSRSPLHAPSPSWTRCYIRPWGAHHLPCVQVHNGGEEADGDVDDDDEEADGDVDDDDEEVDGDVDDDNQVGVPQQGRC